MHRMQVNWLLMQNRRQKMKKTLLVVLIILALGIGGVYLYLRTGVADYAADINAPGLSAPVSVERNRFAVPTITANTKEDLFFAWGYVNAQDRIFQMEFTRRVGQGRIAEFAGEEALSKDIFLRGVGFEERAKAYAESLDPRSRELYQRYVDGINHYLNLNGRHLYMKLLGMEKERWEISDSVVVGLMLNWSLAYNLKHELLYHRIINKVGMEKGNALLSFTPPDTPTIIDDVIASRMNENGLAALAKRLDWLLGSRSASNSWAIAPAMTAHGGAIFSSDMQVHQSKLPNDFYLIRVRAGDFEVTGAQVVGLPFIASGYNRNCAWGLTNQGADMVDLFRENIDWDRKTYRYKGEDIPLAEKQFQFAIKGKDPVTRSIYYAGGKPVLTEVFKDLGFDVSLDWTGFDALEFQGFFLMNAATNYEAFMAGARQVRMSPQNLTYADSAGNIAFRVIGSLPLRVEGTGNLIGDGENTRRNWVGNVPDDAYPLLKNPARGFIISANNLNVKDYPYALNGTYAPGYRYENIARMLRRRSDIDVDYLMQVQTDTRTVLARKVADIIRQHVKLDPQEANLRKAHAMVLAWDGDNTVDSPAAAIHNTFYVRFAFNTFADELGDDLAAEYIGERYISMERFFDMVDRGDAFFNDVNTPGVESVSDIATRAFRETCELLEKHFKNADPERWKWGEIHAIRFDHVLGESTLFRPLVNYGPFHFEGDSETNNRAKFSEVAPPFTADLASAPRIIVRFDPAPRGYMMLITGQNEHFMSRHYTDMTDAWRRHEYFAIDDEPVVYRMQLKP
jgi:penicillin G amidase